MAEEAGNIAKPICFVAVDGIVVFGEGRFEKIRPQPIELRKALPNKTVELRVGPFLRTTLNHHGR
jgi:hypothetical protein